MRKEELKERMQKAIIFLDKLKEYVNSLHEEIRNVRRVSIEITTMIIMHTKDIRDQMILLARRIVALEKKH